MLITNVVHDIMNCADVQTGYQFSLKIDDT